MPNPELFLLAPDDARARAAAEALFASTGAEIRALLPYAADIRHIGATAVPGCLTKGDLDIVVNGRTGADGRPALRLQPEPFRGPRRGSPPEGPMPAPGGVAIAFSALPGTADNVRGLAGKIRPLRVAYSRPPQKTPERRSAARYRKSAIRLPKPEPPNLTIEPEAEPAHTGS
jgi:hypothetical protein